MKTFMMIMVGIGLLVTLGILFAGLIVMSRGGAVNDRWGNRLMRWRVFAQGGTIALFVLLLLLAR